MSFSTLISDVLTGEPDRILAWKKAFLELQVVLAYSDGVLAPAEKMTLSLMGMAECDEDQNRRMVDTLIQSIETHGVEQAASSIVDTLSHLIRHEREEVREKLAQKLLRESIAIIVADDVISPKEERFILERLGPGLGIEDEQSRELLRRASGRLSRSRAYLERGYECYLMLDVLASGSPFFNGPKGSELPLVLGAVDAFVREYRLSSSRVVAYFLTGWAGVYWIKDHEEHLASLARLTEAARKVVERHGVEGRLQGIHHELEQLRNRGVDAHGFRSVARHTVNALARMHDVNEAQRKRFEQNVAPALEIDLDALVAVASERDSMQGLYRNLVGQEAKVVQEGSSRWWKFWK